MTEAEITHLLALLREWLMRPEVLFFFRPLLVAGVVLAICGLGMLQQALWLCQLFPDLPLIVATPGVGVAYVLLFASMYDPQLPREIYTSLRKYLRKKYASLRKYLIEKFRRGREPIVVYYRLAPLPQPS